MVLGVGRAIGEAMAVMMVAGNSPNMPASLFRASRFLTTAIAKEMSYAGGLQRQALFSIALVLFSFIMLINVVLNFFLKGGKGAMKNGFRPPAGLGPGHDRLIWAGAVLVCALVAFIGYGAGAGHPPHQLEFLSTTASVLKGTDGILPAILNTLYVILLTTADRAAAGRGRGRLPDRVRLQPAAHEVIEFADETLAGIPSIIYGLVGMLVFCQSLGFKTSLLSGA